jgi:hypothetical protein
MLTGKGGRREIGEGIRREKGDRRQEKGNVDWKRRKKGEKRRSDNT